MPVEVYDVLEGISERYFGDTRPIRDPAPSGGGDITSDIHLHPDEAASGVVVPLRMTAHENCRDCTGSRPRVPPE